ncbi:hypothetical protein C2845_PM03G28970 [Panicum miliaceum]|uniref:Uncharacterized protein n=1 Tax=Panicum miliaceum TaxID=4540 RepID=A0A3L6T810_PANMI|nr:hypothetical protein C2845_PM03G28970 [Panicum miliaceum]
MLLTTLFGAGAALLGWQHLPLASQIWSKVHSLSSPSSPSQIPSSPSRGHRLARPRRRRDGPLALARPQYGLDAAFRAPRGHSEWRPCRVRGRRRHSGPCPRAACPFYEAACWRLWDAASCWRLWDAALI